jgi:hypothetical protein
MDAIRQIMQSNLTSALIMEYDVGICYYPGLILAKVAVVITVVATVNPTRSSSWN